MLSCMVKLKVKYRQFTLSPINCFLRGLALFGRVMNGYNNWVPQLGLYHKLSYLNISMNVNGLTQFVFCKIECHIQTSVLAI